MTWRCWSWNSNPLATWCEEPTHMKGPWCWERLKAGGEGDDRGWDGWVASPTPWTWVWVSSGSRWQTGRPGVAAVHGVSKSQTGLSDWTEVNCRVVQLAWVITTGWWYVKGSFTHSPCNLQVTSLFARKEKESSFFSPSLRHVCMSWARKTSSKSRCSSNLCVTRNKSWEMWYVTPDAAALCDVILIWWIEPSWRSWCNFHFHFQDF